ncbi:MAG: efflux RND transporter permease subunit [Lentisphaeraceae bacterium]|nr:efflux RND transporter permease subunit [Lentisphaeraceae bacterium]
MLNKIIAFSLKNRVFVVIAALLIAFFGAYIANDMPIDVLPNLNRPTVVIMTEAHAMVPEDVW